MSSNAKAGSVEISPSLYINLENKHKDNTLYNFKIYPLWVNAKFSLGPTYAVLQVLYSTGM